MRTHTTHMHTDEQSTHPHTDEPDMHRERSTAGVWGSLAVRMVLTIAGAVGLIVGALSTWTRGLAGTELTNKAFYREALERSDNFVTSAGAIIILLGLVALLGLAPRTGWLTRIAGALGLIGFILFVVTLSRVGADLPNAIQFGPWLVLAASVALLIGGFMNPSRSVSTTRTSTATDSPIA